MSGSVEYLPFLMCTHGGLSARDRHILDLAVQEHFPIDGTPETLMLASFSNTDPLIGSYHHFAARRVREWWVFGKGQEWALNVFAINTRLVLRELVRSLVKAMEGNPSAPRALLQGMCLGCDHACGSELRIPTLIRPTNHPFWHLRSELHTVTVRVDCLVELIGIGSHEPEVSGLIEEFCGPNGAAASILSCCQIIGKSLPYLASKLIVLLSAIVSLRPKHFVDLNLSIGSLGIVIHEHLGHAAALSFSSECTVEDQFGRNMALDAAPLLLFLPSLPQHAEWLRNTSLGQTISQSLVSFLCNFAHEAAGQYDSTPSTEEFAELSRTIHASQCFFLAQDEATLRVFADKPKTYAAICFLEIIGTFQRSITGGFLHLPAMVSCGPPMKNYECIEEYEDRLLHASSSIHLPSFSFAANYVKLLRRGNTPPIPKDPLPPLMAALTAHAALLVRPTV